MRILVVEDDEILQSLLKLRLSAENYAIDAAIDGLKGWEYASTYEYDLLILDVVLPKLDGLSLCQRLRHAGYTLPILMLTSQDTSSAKIMGLDAGADDYMVKPFDEPELIARVRALLRRGSTNPLPIVTCGDLHLNSSSHEVFYGKTLLNLTAKEYALLEMMMRESQHVFSNEEILESLWSSEEFPVDATVRSHMRRLRNKLTAVGAPPDLIATSHGRGYYLKFVPSTSPSVSPSSTSGPITALPSSPLPAITSPIPASPIPALPIPASPIPVSRIPALPVQGSPLHSNHYSSKYVSEKLPVSSSDVAEPSNADITIQPTSRATYNTTQLKSTTKPSEAEQQIQYLELLNQTWQQHRSSCLDRLTVIRIAIEQLEIDQLNPELQAEAYRVAHTLVGSLGTFGLHDAMELARSLDQELHHDLYVEPSQADYLRSLLQQLQIHIETTESIDHLPVVPAQGREGAKSKLRLMLVDDDPLFLKVFSPQLQHYGFQVSTLNHPEQFWTLLENIHPDVLVLDVKMPKMTGLSLCQALRTSPNWQKIPVLFLSSDCDIKTQQEAFAVGADDYLCKPMTARHLTQRIQHRLQRIQAIAKP